MSKRGLLLLAAERLFNAEGFHAAGIDRILAEAGVAKMTLYKHFSSKDDLAAAAVREKSARVLEWLGAAESVEEVFERLEAWFGEKDFHGCLFARAAQDFPDHAHP
ncbi:MAG TPA: helix-turn-helix domain-containing protein, partial [Sphingomonadales bacterium]|nr:helix-turn-helix domain-containing protein [Sphingomonadales bacterium]